MIIDSSMVISGFVSKVVNEFVDILEIPIKNALKNADQNRKDNNQNIETRIYQVTIDSIKEFTKRDYKDQDVLYDAAESILIGFIRNKDDKVEAVRAGLKMLVSQVTSDTCEDFLRVLCYVICKEENRDLAIEVIILQQDQTNGYVQEGFRRSFLNDEEINQKLDFLIKELINKKVHEERYVSEVPIINRADKYAQNWNENVFLNNFDEEDERAGDRVNVKLRDIYLDELLPFYKLNRNQGLSDNLKGRLEKYIVDKKDRKMLLILGQPGIGKSTLITWIMANLVEKIDEIFVYKFASCLKKIDWQGEDILEEITKALRLGDEELKDKVLILDGFDEIQISGDRERILNKLNYEVEAKMTLGNFSLIITCRENYVNSLHLTVKSYITLQAWNEDQIISFCNIYKKKSLGNLEAKFPEAKSNEILKNKEIFGIPLILYMILALDIDVEKSSSIVDIYDQIFSVKNGGIYERRYDTEHRINAPEIKKCIYQISQRIAFWIFENNADEAFISKDKFEKICEIVKNELGGDGEKIKSDTLIGNFFRLKHCEGKGTDELRFVHRSIYEYFVVIYFFESIHNLTSKEEVAGKLGELLKDGHLSEQILEFVKYKFASIKDLSDITKEVFNIMLRDGMTYYTKLEIPYSNAIERERNIFSNMLKVVGLWNSSLGKLDKRIIIYLQCNREKWLNLRGYQTSFRKVDMEKIDFDGVDLKGVELRKADLEGVDLREANLSRANLVGAELREADLREAFLIGAELREADLVGADLRGAYLTRTDLRGACLSEADLSGVDLSGADLSRADLSRAVLSGANLIGASLSKANLSGANLSEANLSRAYLRGADLRGADLEHANLSAIDLEEIVFDEKQVYELCKKYDLSACRVYLSKMKKIVSYKDYYTKKQCE